MKKIYLLACLVAFSLAGYSQSFQGPTTANSGSTITLIVTGEDNNPTGNGYAITSVSPISNTRDVTSPFGTTGVTLSNFNPYFSATI